MDFTVIPNHIKKTLENSNCPLSDDQFYTMLGCLGAIQMFIKDNGLDLLIERLSEPSK